MNFANHVDRVARDNPGKPAITDPWRELSFEELAAETNAVANAFASLGVAPGDRVALYLPNSVTFITAYFGTMKLGAIPFPINMRFTGSEIEYVLDDAGAVAAVTTGQFEDTIGGLTVDSLDHLVVADGTEGHDYGDLVASADTEYEVYPRKEGELAELMYTSGTTGRPKGVKHTHGNLDVNARGLVRYMHWDEHEVTVTVCPCFHVAGLNVTTTPFLYAGATNHLLPQWDPEATLETIEARGVTYLFLIPTMAIDLLNYDGVGEFDVSTLDTIGVGGSPMPKERIEAVEETFDCLLLEGYGMTETTPLAAINRPDQAVYKPGSIGPPATEVVDVRIEDPETGEAVATDEVGELLWHGDTVTPGYYRMPEKNEEAFVEREGKTWLRSGDLGRLDPDGHLFIEDRLDDMIITGGENVYPSEVEDVLYGIDGVTEAAVIDTPDDRLGQLVTAVVVAADDSLTEADIDRAFDRSDLAGYKHPRRVEFVEELPKTSTRKIDKVTLRDRFD